MFRLATNLNARDILPVFHLEALSSVYTAHYEVRTMITAEKRYGAWVLSPASKLFNAEKEDNADELQEYVRSIDTFRSALRRGIKAEVPCVIPPRWLPLRLSHIQPYNSNTSVFTFQLPYAASRLGLVPGAHLLVRAPDAEHGGGDAIRPYAAVSDPAVRGSFDILVKRYDAWGSPANEAGVGPMGHSVNAYRKKGAVSSYIFSLREGDVLHFKHSRSCRSKVSTDVLLGRASGKGKGCGRGAKRSQSILGESAPGKDTGVGDSEVGDWGTEPAGAGAGAAPLGGPPSEGPPLGPGASSDSSEGALPFSPSPPKKPNTPAPAFASPRLRNRLGGSVATAASTRTSVVTTTGSVESVSSHCECAGDGNGNDSDCSFESEGAGTDADTDAGLAVDSLTILAVGAGIAPIIQILRTALYGASQGDPEACDVWEEWAALQEGELQRLQEQREAKQKVETFTYSSGSGGATISFQSTPKQRGWNSGNSWNSTPKHWIGAEDNAGSPNANAATTQAQVKAEPQSQSQSQSQSPPRCSGSSNSSSKSNTPPRSRSTSVSRFRYAARSNAPSDKLKKIVFLYGCRTVEDILCKDLLLQFERDFPDRFKVVFCVGSRYDNVHVGANVFDGALAAAAEQDKALDRPQSDGFAALSAHKEAGWVNFDSVQKHQASSPLEAGTPPGSHRNTRVVVCGLPAVYENLCGSRFSAEVPPHCVLGRLGYESHHVIKL